MHKYLLLGGTGAMGIYLQEELLKKKGGGGEVYVTSRKPREPKPHIHYIVGDAHDMSFLKTTLARVKPDVVVDFMVYSTYEFLDRYKILLNSTGQYIFLSTYRVFADTQPLIESSPRLLDVCTDQEYLRTDEYAMTKARQENLLRESRFRNWTIIRPSITYSKSRFQFGCLEAGIVCYRALQGLPVIMPTEMLDKRTTMTWAGDVARMISGLTGNDAALSDDFNVVTSESLTWRDVAKIYKTVLGMVVREVSLADYLTICAKYQTCYDRLFDRVMDNKKVLQVARLRQEDLKPLATGLTRELEDFKNMPKYQYGVDYGANGRIDSMCGTWIKLDKATRKEKLIYLSSRFKVMGFFSDVARVLKRNLIN